MTHRLHRHPYTLAELTLAVLTLAVLTLAVLTRMHLVHHPRPQTDRLGTPSCTRLYAGMPPLTRCFSLATRDPS